MRLRRRRQTRPQANELPPAFRDVVRLRDLEDRSPADVARRLHLSRANVAVRLHRAHRLLRQIVERRLLRGSLAGPNQSTDRAEAGATTRVFNSDAVVDVLSLHAECDVADVPYGQFEKIGGFAAGLEDESVFLLVGKSFLF